MKLLWGGLMALAAAAAQEGYVGSKSCAPCHQAQYETFRRAPMGRSLVPMTSAVASAFGKPMQIFHRKTGRGYRVSRKQGDLLIEEFAKRDGQPVYSDTRRVSYAIGSGNHAQSFLVERPGRMYQAPLTFYAQSRIWDMSPGYDTESYVGFGRRVTANCLFCHAGRVNLQNRTGDVFQASQPFAETAIGCERCHGPGKKHLAQPGKAIVHPAKLATVLRDQVCDQCHLFGAARVSQPGKSPTDYRPGKPLGAVLAVYGYGASGPTVTGHPQEMQQSVCRQRSQDKLWCGSCHEVHTTVPAAGRAAFYRMKCFSCHEQDGCGRTADPASAAHRENNCIACHMPKRPVVESAHVTFTDHRILRKPDSNPATPPEQSKLRLILPAEQDDPVVATRNLGFAYAELASSTGRDEFHSKVVETLQPLVGTSVADAQFWQNLGEAHLARGDTAKAEEAFRAAAGLEPNSASTHYGLGYLLQLRGNLEEAIQAYRRALALDPYKAEALGNLAAAYFSMGQDENAVKALEAALKLEPGNLRWRAAAEKYKRPREAAP